MANVIKLTEKQWMAQVVQYARMRSWMVYHTFDSRRSAAGFPDIVAVREPRLVFIECKTDERRSKVTSAQQYWLDCLAGVPCAEVYVLRPGDWAQVEEVLR